ncbi:MAG: ribonuclease R, partial [Bacteroides sp.]
MAKRTEKKAGKRMKKGELAEKLMNLFRANPTETLNPKYIFAELQLNTHPLKMLCMDIIYDLLADDYLGEVEKGKYKLNDRGTVLVGTFQRKSNGKNSFIPEGG